MRGLLDGQVHGSVAADDSVTGAAIRGAEVELLQVPDSPDPAAPLGRLTQQREDAVNEIFVPLFGDPCGRGPFEKGALCLGHRLGQWRKCDHGFRRAHHVQAVHAAESDRPDFVSLHRLIVDDDCGLEHEVVVAARDVELEFGPLPQPDCDLLVGADKWNVEVSSLTEQLPQERGAEVVEPDRCRRLCMAESAEPVVEGDQSVEPFELVGIEARGIES